MSGRWRGSRRQYDEPAVREDVSMKTITLYTSPGRAQGWKNVRINSRLPNSWFNLALNE